jgi:hypothetical protein
VIHGQLGTAAVKYGKIVTHAIDKTSEKEVSGPETSVYGTIGGHDIP